MPLRNSSEYTCERNSLIIALMDTLSESKVPVWKKNETYLKLLYTSRSALQRFFEKKREWADEILKSTEGVNPFDTVAKPRGRTR